MDYETLKNIDINSIFLDPNNPRFVEGTFKIPLENIPEPDVQKSCEEQILKLEDLSDLKESIKKVGYIPVNSIVVKKIPLDGNVCYYVVEGNCRLLTMKILYKEFKQRKIHLEPNIVKSISKLNVIEFVGSNENIAYELQGICHLIKQKDWSPKSQGEFLVRKMESVTPNFTPTQAGKIFGLSPQISNKLARATFAFRQLENDEIYGNKVKHTHYSYMEEAIKLKKLREEFLEWDDSKREFKNIENLRMYYSWFIGDEDGIKKITRAIDVRDLKHIISDPELVDELDDPDGDEETLKDIIRAKQGKDEPTDTWEYVSNVLNSKLEALDSISIGTLDDPDTKSDLKNLVNKIIDKSNWILNNIKE